MSYILHSEYTSMCSIDSFAGKTLTWTQYGRAQIKCNNTSILLNISTIQMIIIMAFNDIVGKVINYDAYSAWLAQ